MHQSLAPNPTLPGTDKGLARAAADTSILTEIKRRDTAAIVLSTHALAGGQQAQLCILSQCNVPVPARTSAVARVSDPMMAMGRSRLGLRACACQ